MLICIYIYSRFVGSRHGLAAFLRPRLICLSQYIYGRSCRFVGARHGSAAFRGPARDSPMTSQGFPEVSLGTPSHPQGPPMTSPAIPRARGGTHKDPKRLPKIPPAKGFSRIPQGPQRTPLGPPTAFPGYPRDALRGRPGSRSPRASKYAVFI